MNKLYLPSNIYDEAVRQGIDMSMYERLDMPKMPSIIDINKLEQDKKHYLTLNKRKHGS